MKNTHCAVFMAGFLAVHAAAFAGHPDLERFLSPGGNIEVSFQKIEHKKFTEEEFRRNVDNVNHVRYRIEFRRNDTKEPVADAEYADVYGWTAEARPTPPETIFKEMIWSPREDFAVVPASAWASAPGTEHALAVALDPKSPWKSADFYLEDLAWVDDWRVVGDTHGDCDYSVNLFDGRTGRTVPVKPAQSPEGESPRPLLRQAQDRLLQGGEISASAPARGGNIRGETPSGQTVPIKAARSPVGYEIRSVEGRNAVIQKVLDNCRTEEDKKTFVTTCYLLNLDTLTEHPVSCPKE